MNSCPICVCANRHGMSHRSLKPSGTLMLRSSGLGHSSPFQKYCGIKYKSHIWTWNNFINCWFVSCCLQFHFQLDFPFIISKTDYFLNQAESNNSQLPEDPRGLISREVHYIYNRCIANIIMWRVVCWSLMFYLYTSLLVNIYHNWNCLVYTFSNKLIV